MGSSSFSINRSHFLSSVSSGVPFMRADAPTCSHIERPPRIAASVRRSHASVWPELPMQSQPLGDKREQSPGQRSIFPATFLQNTGFKCCFNYSGLCVGRICEVCVCVCVGENKKMSVLIRPVLPPPSSPRLSAPHSSL